ncbi:MAG: hypothetical protein U1D30_17730 [Planctomycetota bacterium]
MNAANCGWRQGSPSDRAGEYDIPFLMLYNWRIGDGRAYGGDG